MFTKYKNNPPDYHADKGDPTISFCEWRGNDDVNKEPSGTKSKEYIRKSHFFLLFLDDIWMFLTSYKYNLNAIKCQAIGYDSIVLWSLHDYAFYSTIKPIEWYRNQALAKYACIWYNNARTTKYG